MKNIKFKKVKVKEQGAKTLCVITVITFIIAVLFSYIFEVLLKDVPLLLAFFMLIVIITIGIIFDGIGNAVVAVDEVTFHAMAASKVKGARESLILIRNAPMVANLFNDVIGDICGVISGSMGTAIVLSLEQGFGRESILLSIAMSGFIAASTVGGKAVGKSFSIARARYIVYYVGIIIFYIKKIVGRKK